MEGQLILDYQAAENLPSTIDLEVNYELTE